MWEYVVYGVIVTSVLIECPNEDYYCDVIHEKEIATDFEGRFRIKKNAVRYMDIKNQEGVKNIKLDSIKLD